MHSKILFLIEMVVTLIVPEDAVVFDSNGSNAVLSV